MKQGRRLACLGFMLSNDQLALDAARGNPVTPPRRQYALEWCAVKSVRAARQSSVSVMSYHDSRAIRTDSNHGRTSRNDLVISRWATQSPRLMRGRFAGAVRNPFRVFRIFRGCRPRARREIEIQGFRSDTLRVNSGGSVHLPGADVRDENRFITKRCTRSCGRRRILNPASLAATR